MDVTNTPNTFAKWKPIEIMLAVLFLVAPFYYHDNVGGYGLFIPFNITVWLITSIIIGYSFYIAADGSIIILPKYYGYILAFPILIAFSGFIIGIDQPLKWLFRLLFIWGGLLFFISLFQHKLKQGRVDRLLFLFVISALLHSLIGIAQFWFRSDLPQWLPNSSNGIPSGLFQQINNQATYQVTAIVVSAYLITRPFAIFARPLLTILLLLTVACAGFIVIISGSRIGALSFLISLFILIPCGWKQYKRNAKLSLVTASALILGMVIGAFQGNVSAIDKTVAIQSGYSGAARLGIYSISLDLINESPILGHGIGSFGRVWQYQKPDFYKQYPNATLPDKYISHPHNEIIYWIVEGGLIAVIGLILLVVGVSKALKQLGWHHGLMSLSLLLPILLHTQVELPFYTSSIHWMIFLFITFNIFLKANLIKKEFGATWSLYKKWYLLFCSSLYTLVILFLIHTMFASRELVGTNEARELTSDTFSAAMANPFTRHHIEWIIMRTLAQQSIINNNKRGLKIYADWSRDKIKTVPDKELFMTLLQVEEKLGDSNHCEIQKTAHEIYPNEASFNIKSYCKI